jgi:preprotein translocase subunit SecY
VQYAKRVVGNKMMGGASTHLPAARQHLGRHPRHLRLVDHRLPRQTLIQMFAPNNAAGCSRSPSSSRWGMPLYNLLYVTFIIFFCYFYTAIVFNPEDVAENMRKAGGFIPGIRPGKRTAEYLDKVLGRITFGGADLPRHHRAPARVPDHRVQGGADSSGRPLARRFLHQQRACRGSRRASD